jgi:adenylate cyclase
MLEGTQRRLAAIVAIDVAGYSRLMGADEDGTLAALKAHREAVSPIVRDHGGRIVGTAGDGLLLEFPSVTEAVLCATKVQPVMTERNADMPDDQKMLYRIGINLGDVMIDGEDVYGDGVNIAARLEALADPGSICISQIVLDALGDRLDIDFEDLGEVEVKNIARPVRVWRWTPEQPAKSEPESAGPDATAAPLPLPDKPSIAVLPFDNMSGDSEQEYFSDGMTEDIITALSRLRWLFVIARNSSFTYKGRAVDVKEVGREMGVRYVLEGSVRKSGARVRVTAQLVETDTGNHIWAERYDRELADIFELQDELTEAICSEVNAELGGSERQQAHRKSNPDLDAWDLYQRGMWHFYKYNKDDMTEARRLLLLSIEKAPEFASPYAALGVFAFSWTMLGFTEDRTETLEQGLRNAEKAIALDDRDGYGYHAFGRICTILGDRDRALPALRKSVDLSPSSMLNVFGLGYGLWWFGQATEALPLFTRCIRFSPHDPQLWMFHYMRSISHWADKEFELAADEAKAAIQVKSDEFFAHVALALACTNLQKDDVARSAVERARELLPKLSLAYMNSVLGALNPSYLQRWLEDLRNSGLPEE